MNAVKWLFPLAVFGAVIALVCTALTQPVKAPPDAPVPTATAGTFPLTIEEAGGRKVTIQRQPLRIVPTNAGLADLLTELVDGKRIAGIPFTSDEFGGAAQYYREHPEIFRYTKADGETLLALKPDLVLWSGFQEETTVRALEAQGIPVLRFDFYRTTAAMRQALLTVAAAVGEPEKGRLLEKTFGERLAAVQAAVKDRPHPRVVSYSNYGTGFAVGLEESQDELLRLAGAVNAAAELKKNGHFNITFEELLKLNPDWLVVSGDQGLDSPQAQILLSEPALRELACIKGKRIAVVPDRFYSNINHHVATAVEILARQLHAEAFTPAAPKHKVPPAHP